VFDVGAPLEWTAAKAAFGYTEGPTKYSCVTATSMNFTAQTTPAKATSACTP
jgi:hypothetical protein